MQSEMGLCSYSHSLNCRGIRIRQGLMRAKASYEGQTGAHAPRQGTAAEHGRGDAADVRHNFCEHGPRHAGSVHPAGETELTSLLLDMQ